MGAKCNEVILIAGMGQVGWACSMMLVAKKTP